MALTSRIMQVCAPVLGEDECVGDDGGSGAEVEGNGSHAQDDI